MCNKTWFILFSFLAININAETLTLQNGLDGYTGTSDNSIYADRTNNSNGAGVHLFSGATTSSVRRMLIKFDLSSLPINAVITQVELQLMLNRSGRDGTDDDVYTLHRLTSDWGEAESDAGEPGGNGTAAQSGDATWLSNFHQQSDWTTPGGDFVEVPSATAIFSSEPGFTVSISGEGMIEDAQNWLENPESNFGWILIGDEEGTRNARRFNSNEAASDQPALIIEFENQTNVSQWNLY